MRKRSQMVIGIVGLMLLAAPASANPPLWDKVISGQRFKVLKKFNAEAVVDRETGLVWERSPRDTVLTWQFARATCRAAETGGRLGWHLPTVEELMSLFEVTEGSPKLRSRHPFVLPNETGPYWTATTIDGFPTSAIYVKLPNANLVGNPKTSEHYLWCVRGGSGPDGF